MTQKIIQIGNSIGIVIPQALAKDSLKLGDEVVIEKDPVSNTLFINKQTGEKSSTITPEFFSWLKKFNKRYKNALSELAKK